MRRLSPISNSMGELLEERIEKSRKEVEWLVWVEREECEPFLPVKGKIPICSEIHMCR